ncbi:MAG TPA: hypothetical protein VFT64_10990 [Rickettsiales bacterium]|nr:hypothetical protein [Rickettsiales bacterium]
MWSGSYSKKVIGLSAEEVWNVWTDVNQWHTWQDDIDLAEISGAFAVGNHFLFKPKGGPKFTIAITEVTVNRSFTDVTPFLLAKMYDSHELVMHPDGLEIKSTISVDGPFAFLWRKLVAENVVKGLEQQTDRLVQRVRSVYGK